MRKRLTLLAPILALLSAVGASADVGILVEYIETDERSATKLIRKHGGKANADALREDLRAKVAAGEAKISSTSYTRTRSGQRSKVESIHEMIYPTEFDPPEIPQEVTGPIEPGVDLKTHANPTAFEMRPVGATVEVDPVVGGDGKTIELNIAPEIVEFVGFKLYGKDVSEVRQPIFYTMKTATAVTTTSGSYLLLGMHTPRAPGEETLLGDQSKRVLVIVRATVLETVEVKGDVDEEPKQGDADDPFGS